MSLTLRYVLLLGTGGLLAAYNPGPIIEQHVERDGAAVAREMNRYGYDAADAVEDFNRDAAWQIKRSRRALAALPERWHRA